MTAGTSQRTWDGCRTQKAWKTMIGCRDGCPVIFAPNLMTRVQSWPGSTCWRGRISCNWGAMCTCVWEGVDGKASARLKKKRRQSHLYVAKVWWLGAWAVCDLNFTSLIGIRQRCLELLQQNPVIFAENCLESYTAWRATRNTFKKLKKNRTYTINTTVLFCFHQRWLIHEKSFRTFSIKNGPTREIIQK